mmetsp:Transcript_22487/g.73032  ORF Transcript_22487/g.73032 Transcript_22487/m.73032 type:complete len:448 (-) Transcript_22487:910-2253(-)
MRCASLASSSLRRRPRAVCAVFSFSASLSALLLSFPLVMMDFVSLSVNPAPLRSALGCTSGCSFSYALTKVSSSVASSVAAAAFGAAPPASALDSFPASLGVNHTRIDLSHDALMYWSFSSTWAMARTRSMCPVSLHCTCSFTSPPSPSWCEKSKTRMTRSIKAASKSWFALSMCMVVTLSPRCRMVCKQLPSPSQSLMVSSSLPVTQHARKAHHFTCVTSAACPLSVYLSRFPNAHQTFTAGSAAHVASSSRMSENSRQVMGVSCACAITSISCFVCKSQKRKERSCETEARTCSPQHASPVTRPSCPHRMLRSPSSGSVSTTPSGHSLMVWSSDPVMSMSSSSLYTMHRIDPSCPANSSWHVYRSVLSSEFGCHRRMSPSDPALKSCGAGSSVRRTTTRASTQSRCAFRTRYAANGLYLQITSCRALVMPITTSVPGAWCSLWIA